MVRFIGELFNVDVVTTHSMPFVNSGPTARSRNPFVSGSEFELRKFTIFLDFCNSAKHLFARNAVNFFRQFNLPLT